MEGAIDPSLVAGRAHEQTTTPASQCDRFNCKRMGFVQATEEAPPGAGGYCARYTLFECAARCGAPLFFLPHYTVKRAVHVQCSVVCYGGAAQSEEDVDTTWQPAFYGVGRRTFYCLKCGARSEEARADALRSWQETVDMQL
jgi:hypothetical protein